MRPAEAAAYLSTVPLVRSAPAGDIGATWAFPCPGETDCITGSSLPVDGGQVLTR